VGAAQCLPSGRAIFAAGLDALSRGDLPTAHARFDELVKAQPNCAEARNNLAVVLFEMGQVEEADAELRRAVELNPSYPRARANLRRVEAVFQGQKVKPEIEPVVPGAPPTPLGATAAGARTPPMSSETPRADAIPPNLFALEPDDATACTLAPTHKELCVYRKTRAGITRDACYAILAAQVPRWPQWTVLTDNSARRLRFSDSDGTARFRIVPPDVQTADHHLRILQRDFDALAATLTLWRSACVVLTEPPLAAPTARAAGTAVRQALERWRQAWEGRQFDPYIAAYGPRFVPQPERDLDVWRARKRKLLDDGGEITVQVVSPNIFVLEAGASVVTVFEQVYKSAPYTSRGFKALRWTRHDDRWSIDAETMLWEQGQR
jgi:hypothetical protein